MVAAPLSMSPFVSPHVPFISPHAPRTHHTIANVSGNQNQNEFTILNAQNQYIDYESYWPAEPKATRALRKNMKSSVLDRNTSVDFNIKFFRGAAMRIIVGGLTLIMLAFASWGMLGSSGFSAMAEAIAVHVDRFDAFFDGAAFELTTANTRSSCSSPTAQRLWAQS